MATGVWLLFGVYRSDMSFEVSSLSKTSIAILTLVIFSFSMNFDVRI